MSDRATAIKKLAEYEDLVYQISLRKADYETKRRTIIPEHVQLQLLDLEMELSESISGAEGKLEGLKKELRDLAPDDGNVRGELYNLIRVETRTVDWKALDGFIDALKTSANPLIVSIVAEMQRCIKITSYGKIDPIRDRRDSKS